MGKSRLGLLVLVTLLFGFGGRGRFRPPPDVGDLGPALAEVHNLVRPLYELRGALFLIRLELARALAEPTQELALQDWASLSPADAGWVAARLADARGGKIARINDIAVEVAKTLGKDAELSQIAGGFRALVEGEALRPNGRLDVVARAVTRFATDSAARDRLWKRLDEARHAAERLAKSVGRVPSVAKHLGKAVRAVARNAKRAGDGKGEAIAALAIDGILVARALEPVLRDVKAVPAVVEEIAAELKTLPTALGGLGAELPGALPDGVALDVDALSALESLRGSVPARDFLARLAEALERPPCTRVAVTRLEVTAPARKPNGKAWDAMGGAPDLKVAWATGSTAIARDQFTAEWPIMVVLPDDQGVAVALTDADLLNDDPIAQWSLTVPDEPGLVVEQERNGATLKWTATCLD